MSIVLSMAGGAHMRKYDAKPKNQRTLHVISQSEYKYEPVPTIILKGKWLKECRFNVGDTVIINSSRDKLNIERN